MEKGLALNDDQSFKDPEIDFVKIAESLPKLKIDTTKQ